MDHSCIPMQQQQRQMSGGGEGTTGNVGGGRSGGGSATGGAPCRPSGARWTPTGEQIRFLRELYDKYGMRSPTSEQIQRITAMLRRHGKIEGKNVFYWFQNHKARERQKKRLTTLDVNTSSSSTCFAAGDVNHLGVLSLSPSGAAAASPYPGWYAGNDSSALQQQANTSSWDSTAMATERGFLQLEDYMGVRSTGGHGGTGGAAPWACFPFAEQTATATTREPETLPLFPTGDSSSNCRPRHGGPGETVRQESVVHGNGNYLPNFQCWGPAAATTMTVQQQQLLQMQHSFCSGHGAAPAPPPASASLELTLSFPHPAGYM